MEWVGKNVTVVGLARSGIAAARLLHALGARVSLADQKQELDLGEHVLGEELKDAELFLGNRYPLAMDHAEAVVISPGVPSRLPLLNHIRSRGVPVLGELELASRYISAPIIGVTGTNGKSTTVTLIGRCLQRSGLRVFVGGNLGIPVSEAALARVQSDTGVNGTTPELDFVVAEISSFQLETVSTFHPRMAALLNISPDHMDRYESFDQYIETKAKIFANQTETDIALVNVDDDVITRMPHRGLGSTFGFTQRQSVGPDLAGGAYWHDRVLTVALPHRTEVVCAQDEILIQGVHNQANAMAAATIALLAGCPVSLVREELRTFPGLEHAMEVVRDCRGVRFINDSKGTNVDATAKALESFSRPIVLIAGGRSKGGGFAKLAERARDRVKQVVLIGETASELQTVFEPVIPTRKAESLRAAVDIAMESSTPGDIVLFSPACSSFDMFIDYQDRGRQFKHLVKELRE